MFYDTPDYYQIRATLELIDAQSSYIGNIPEAARERLKSSEPWPASARSTIDQTFRSLLLGSLDIHGLPQYEIPVEQVACAIAIFIHPCNYFLMCSWCSIHGSTADNMAQGLEYEPCTPKELYAMVYNTFIKNIKGAGPVSIQDAVDNAVKRALDPSREIPMEAPDVRQAK